MYLAYPLKSLNCIWLHCIRLQKKPSVLQLYPVAMYPVAIVSGCNCIRLYLARLCTCISIVSLYPVAVVSGQMLRIVSQLYLKKPNFFSLYPVAIVSGCTVSGCSFCLFGVATGSRKILPFAQPRRPWRSTDLVSKTTHRSGIGCRPWAYAGLPEFNPVPGRRDEVVTHQSNPSLAPG